VLKDENDRLLRELEVAQEEHDELKQRLMAKALEVEKEEEEISEFKDEREDPDAKLIVMLGKTGSGKSTTCNRIMGDTSEFGDGDGATYAKYFKTSDDPQSCTQTNHKATVTIDEHKITVVDTPGFHDSNLGKDREHSIRLCRYIKGCGGVSAFVFVHNEKRFDQSFQEMLNAYFVMFGRAFFERMVIVFTAYDGIDKKKWDRKKGPKGLTGEICRHFELDFQITAIPIGLEDYTDAVAALVAAIPDDKVEIEEIKSPLDELQKQHAALMSEETELKQKILELQEKHFEIRTQWAAACDEVQSLSSN